LIITLISNLLYSSQTGSKHSRQQPEANANPSKSLPQKMSLLLRKTIKSNSSLQSFKPNNALSLFLRQSTKHFSTETQPPPPPQENNDPSSIDPFLQDSATSKNKEERELTNMMFFFFCKVRV
jgi:hypothetical protein